MRFARGPEGSIGFQDSRRLEQYQDEAQSDRFFSNNFRHRNSDQNSNNDIIPQRRHADRFSPLPYELQARDTSRNLQSQPLRMESRSNRTLPINRQGGRPRDLCYFYNAPGTKYTGLPSDCQSLNEFKNRFYMLADNCGLNAQQGLQNLFVMFEPNSLASHYFEKQILPVARSLEHAFELLESWDYNPSNLKSILREWRNLRITDFKTPLNTWKEAMEKLVVKATTMQSKLDAAHSQPVHLMEVLEAAIRDQPFFQHIDISREHTNSMEYLSMCTDAISKQELLDSRLSRALTTSGTQYSPPMSTPKSPPNIDFDGSRESPCCSDQGCARSQVIHKAFYASAGRRYGVDNRRINHRQQLSGTIIKK